MDIQNFYEKNFDRQVRLIRRSMKFNKDEAEDVVQTAYVNAIDNIDSYDPDRAAFKTWFNKIMFNVLRNLGRNPIHLPLDEEMEGDYVPYEMIVINKEIDYISNPKHRRILKMFYISGHTIKEIQSLTGATQSNITTLSNRFKKILREKYNVKV